MIGGNRRSLVAARGSREGHPALGREFNASEVPKLYVRGPTSRPCFRESLRTLSLPRMAISVRLSLSAIIGTLFLTSNISRNWRSSSLVHGRQAFFILGTISQRAAHTPREAV